MQTLRIAAILMVLLASQGLCRPQNADGKEDDYVEDTPQEYEDTEDEQDDSKGTEPPPEIRSKPLRLQVRVGSTVELPCDVINGDNYVIEWSRGSQSLYFGGAVMTSEPERIQLSANNSLIIKDVTEFDASDAWTCKVLLESNPLELHHSITVLNDPKELLDDRHITVYPSKRIQINESESIRFGCNSTSHQKLEIKWSHKGERPETMRLHNGEILEDGGHTIYIKQATRHNAGKYQCLAEDGSEKPQHEAIEIVVNYAPVIEVEHGKVHTGMGMTSELSCKVHAHPRAKVTWIKDGKPITAKKNKKLLNQDKYLRTLIIEHTTKHDLGTYTCHASNQLGEANKDIELTGVPAKPKFSGGEIVDDEAAFVLKWHVESFSPITEYKLTYRSKDDDKWTEVMPKVTDDKGNQFIGQYQLDNLLPGSYEARLVARNDFGWSPESNIHTFRKEIVSDEPQNVKDSISTTRPFAALVALLLVVSSRVFTCL